MRQSLRVAAGILLLLATVPTPAAPSEEEARKGARLFGQALTTGQAAMMRPLLPPNGKVHLTLDRFGPEEGFFGASQVEALFSDFLSQGSVRSFEVLRLECDGAALALANGRAVLTDRQGRPARVLVHLAFQPEGGRWAIREIKETGE